MAYDFDPASVPIRPAATVMLIRKTRALEVLMMRRHAKTVFAGGMWVFPGGAVDPADFELDIHGQDRIDIPGGTEKPINPYEDRAYYAAAIRECFEESGVLMTTSSALATQPTSSALVEARSALNAGSLPFNEMLATWSMIPDATAMQLVARWVTPVGSPRRFDTRFFITACTDSTQAAHDDQELVDSAWMTPQSVLDAFASGEMDLMTPTLRMLKSLSRHESVGEVFSYLEAHRRFERVRVVNDSRELLLPGEPGYDDALENVETGWVRL